MSTDANKTATGEPVEAEDILSQLTLHYAQETLGEPLSADSPVAQRCCERLDLALSYHQRQFLDAGKPSDRQLVVEQLRAGRFAFGTRDDCDLLSDFFLARFFGERLEAGAARFMERFEGRIRSWARRYAPGDVDLAGSVLGDLLLPRPKAGPRIDSYKAYGPLDGWLRQVVFSLAHRRRDRRGLVLAGVSDDGESSSIDETSYHQGGTALCRPDEDYARRDCTEQLAPLFRDLLAALPKREHIVLMMSLVDGVPQKQIAKLLQVPEYTVSRLKTRAIDNVHRAFFARARQEQGLDTEAVRACLDLILAAFPQANLELPTEATDGEEYET